MVEDLSKRGPLLYWDLIPVYERRGQLATACIVQCIATGKYLSGHGGPSYALDPAIVDALDMAKTGGRHRMIVDQEAWDSLITALDTCRANIAQGLRNIGFDEGSINNYAAVSQADAALLQARRDD